MDMNFDLYMNGVVEQARNEIESAGYEQLTTAEDVDKVLKQDGTTLVMINSVCGCAVVSQDQQHHMLYHYDVLPDRLVTVFAGQDKEATQRAREYFEGYAPSSPSFALVKDGKITEMIERHQIEGHDVMNVINQLQTLFNKYCEER
ncbi:bacillithiol system oxidoreductase, YphP/YqiW family [Staphylococcus aureus]|uniref:Bacillithiol system oxidoreductase, YphP/YqiW family n=1 Tax=Staphylococcus aureus TaxID=1280 RepID=A0A380EKG5_STAAU|nr:bacillithiol system oxidoreductase, YphP/YqiW family [Staphylococcus aureus]